MPDLTRGANAPLNSTSVDICVAGAKHGAVDLIVFQLGTDRMVRSDADFVFFNQPTSPEGAVTLAAGDRVTVNLAAVPVTVETLAVAVALDDSIPGSLAGISGLAVSVRGAGESDDLRAAADGMTIERAAVLVEIYRRAGAWKVKNISAGWAGGLAALATEHGVSVDDDPAPAPPAAAPAPAAPLPTGPAPGALPPANPSPAAPSPAAPVARDMWDTAGSLPTSTSVVPPTPGDWPPPAPDPLSPPPYQAPIAGRG
ncbi:MAG: TerD family protein [Nakamurella sp.]